MEIGHIVTVYPAAIAVPLMLAVLLRMRLS